ncbi:XdhC family protein [Pseudarthrobacter sp. S9]|uniref:XdhC family protein n=1 Tax=Pseudarthrobacter sp. S9 TaxID=3418421 RepID=UPI003D004CAE
MSTTAESLAARADELAGRREPFVHATVVRAQRPTSAHAGDTALVLSTGEIQGFVGGSCVEESVREYSLKALVSQEPLLLRVVPGVPSRTAEEGAVEVSNSCLSGGAIEIFLQPRLPAPRVLVVGTTPVAQALATLGSGVGLAVELTDGEAADPRSDDAALIVASHGKAEEGALEAALRTGVPYVALVASETRGAAVLDSLDVDDVLRSRVYTPAGLQLGARTPGEIALSILAQLIGERSKARRAAPAAAAPAPTTAPAGARADAPQAAPASAIDPVCGMSVPAVESSLHIQYNGATVYFCSPGCRAAFRKDPVRYAVPV